MAIILGADWGKGVYVVARVDLDRMSLEMTTAGGPGALLAMPCDLLAVDMPIGLSLDGDRPCDVAARGFVPGRASSVFNVPVRPVLDTPTYAEATARSRELTGKGLSPQSFGFMRHIREMDQALQDASPAVRDRTWEIHPEVSFAALSAGATLAHRKKDTAGADLRREALGTWLWPSRIEAALAGLPKRVTAPEDVLDAIVAAWSAARILRGESATVTGDVPRDAMGLRMTIAY